MNEPLGRARGPVRLPVHALRRRAPRQPPVLRRRRPARARRAAVRALLRRGSDAQRGVFGAHMEVELVNDGPVTLLIEVPARLPGRMAPEDPLCNPLRRRAAAGRPAHRALGRDAAGRVPRRLPADRRRGRGPRRARRDPLVPRPHVVRAAPTCPPPRARRPASSCSATCRSARRRGRTARPGARRLRVVRRLHGRDGRGEPGLEARHLRGGRRRLARRAGPPRRHDARLGRAARARRRDRDRRAGRARGRPVRAARRPLHADRARRLPRGLPRHQAVQHPRRGARGRVALRGRRADVDRCCGR